MSKAAQNRSFWAEKILRLFRLDWPLGLFQRGQHTCVFNLVFLWYCLICKGNDTSKIQSPSWQRSNGASTPETNWAKKLPLKCVAIRPLSSGFVPIQSLPLQIKKAQTQTLQLLPLQQITNCFVVARKPVTVSSTVGGTCFPASTYCASSTNSPSGNTPGPW